MILFDVKFDGGQGDAEIDLASGVLSIKADDSNPSFPSNLVIDVPLDQIFQRLEAQAPNLLVKWGEMAAKGVIDGIS